MSRQGARAWAAAVRRKGPEPLPGPLEGVSFEQLRLRGLPEDPMATVRQEFAVGFTQRESAVLVDLKQNDPFGRAFARKDDSGHETVSAMVHHRFAPSRVQIKAVEDRAVDTDPQDIAATPGLAKGDQDTGFMSTPIPVDRKAGTTVVFGKDVTASPRLVNVGGDVILKQPGGLAFAENSLLARGIAQLKRMLELQHLVETDGSFRMDLLKKLPPLEDDGSPVGIEQPEQDMPQRLGGDLGLGHRRYRQRRMPVTGCQGASGRYEVEVSVT